MKSYDTVMLRFLPVAGTLASKMSNFQDRRGWRCCHLALLLLYNVPRTAILTALKIH